MTESIIVALITGGLSLVGVLIANRKNSALMTYRLEQLENKVTLHNNMIERTFRLEESVALLEAEDKRHNERLKVLEGKTA